MPLGLSDNLFQRIVSALLLLPPVLGAVYMGGYWFTALLALGGALMMLEWCGLTGGQRIEAKVGSVLLLLAMLVALHLNLAPGILMLFGALAAFVVLGVALIGKNSARVGWLLTGIGYVAFPIAALWWVRAGEGGGLWLLWIFLVVWATDVGGYFAGKGIGGPKLAPRISPKKTWAGLIGGMALSALVSYLMNVIYPFTDSPLGVTLAAALLAVWAQVGDLLESAIKRHFGVKDSGGLIPGHGGLLDRVDGLVFVAPAVVLLFLAAPFLGFEF
jgi:phosphatidate cytidylyltransferase